MFAPPNYALDHYGLHGDLLSTINSMRYMPGWQLRRLIRKDSRFPLGNFIYKYLDFNKEDSFSVQKLKTILVDSRIYLSAPSEFNDPYEFIGNYSFNSDPVKRRKHFYRMARNALSRGQDIFPEINGKERKISAIVTRLSNSYASESGYMDRIMIESSNIFGVCCFSRTARSILMWSYYSAGHSGICLQFNPYKDPGVLMLAQNVIYHKELPMIQIPEDESRLDEKVILSKSDVWSHEHEVRYVSHKVSRGLIDFDGRSLSAIILGVRCSDEKITILKKLLKDREREGLPRPKIYKAGFRKDNYGINFEKISSEFFV